MNVGIHNVYEIRIANQQSAIRTLEAAGFSREAIGKNIGLSGRDSIDKVMQGCQAMGGNHELLLIRAASEAGNEDPANAYSSDGKYAVDLRAKANGEISDDLQKIMEGSGFASAAYRERDLQAMSVHISRAQRGVQGLIAEREAALSRTNGRRCGGLFG